MAEQQRTQQLAEVEDAATATAFQQGAQTMLQAPQEHPDRNEDEVPTEPATSPRQVDPLSREWPVQLEPVQGQVYGPQEEPERYPNQFVMNYGQMTPEQHEAELRNARQAVNAHQWDRQRREEAERANREHEQPDAGNRILRACSTTWSTSKRNLFSTSSSAGP